MFFSCSNESVFHLLYRLILDRFKVPGEWVDPEADRSHSSILAESGLAGDPTIGTIPIGWAIVYGIIGLISAKASAHGVDDLARRRIELLRVSYCQLPLSELRRNDAVGATFRGTHTFTAAPIQSPESMNTSTNFVQEVGLLTKPTMKWL
jgi:hypothetical protein